MLSLYLKMPLAFDQRVDHSPNSGLNWGFYLPHIHWTTECEAQLSYPKTWSKSKLVLAIHGDPFNINACLWFDGSKADLMQVQVSSWSRAAGSPAGRDHPRCRAKVLSSKFEPVRTFISWRSSISSYDVGNFRQVNAIASFPKVSEVQKLWYTSCLFWLYSETERDSGLYHDIIYRIPLDIFFLLDKGYAPWSQNVCPRSKLTCLTIEVIWYGGSLSSHSKWPDKVLSS